MRAELNPSLPSPYSWWPNRASLYGSALAALVISCTAALAIPLLLSRALPAPGEQPLTPVPNVAAPMAPGDTSVPDAGTALRFMHQEDTEAAPTF
ncbi:MAG: hypothetical protein IPP87_07450 [Ideonella sp.]|nr:hypothetical protein [Ideonella sp.]